MTGHGMLAAIVNALSVHATVRPGLAGMVTVNKVPMLVVRDDRVVLLPMVVGLRRIDARTVGPNEDPVRVAEEILERLAASQPVAA
jgi:hypothetical protein